jgi:hypothetical protein
MSTPTHLVAMPMSPAPMAHTWSFLPVILGAAAACLLLYFFLTPGFNVLTPKQSVPPLNSARPGATTQTALPPATKP